jgi:hypothetical protein
MLQGRFALSPPGVDHATFDRGYSSSKSYQLESSIGAQAMIQHGSISLVFVRELGLTD